MYEEKKKIGIEIVTSIISVLGVLSGTILGWTLNCLYDKRARKVKLCYSLQTVATNNERSDESPKNKYSESGYCIQIYNVGQTPYMLENISLRYKNSIIQDLDIIDNKVVMPYEIYTYSLSMQEYDSIIYHCKKSNLKKCKVFTYDVSNKKCVGFLDLSFPYIQCHFRNLK